MAMKKIIIALLLLPFCTVAQHNYTFEEISGKWAEQTRTDKHSDVIPFKDTLYVEIREDGFMMVRHTIGATSYGDAELVENKLSIQREKFTIEALENDMLKLKQNKITHRFAKQKEFADAPVAKVIPGVEHGTIQTTFESLQGKWTVYKKTDPNFKSNTFYIKTLTIQEKKKNNNFVGNVTYHNMDSIFSSNANIQIQDHEMQIVSPEKVLKTVILKNNGEECILQHGSVNYFMKRAEK